MYEAHSTHVSVLASVLFLFVFWFNALDMNISNQKIVNISYRDHISHDEVVNNIEEANWKYNKFLTIMRRKN